MIKFEKALNIILKNVTCMSGEKCEINRSCAGRVICENVISDENIPNCDNSGMDGYAVKYRDTRRPQTKLKIVGEIKAGTKPQRIIKTGEAIRIMTGAPIPEGADAVVMIEKTKYLKAKNEVEILGKLKNNENVRLKGEDIKKGDLVLLRNTVLSPACMGVLASLGKTSIKLVRKPRVSVITTGNEIKHFKAKGLAPGQVRDSNRLSISSSLERDGFTSVFVKKVPDNLKVTKNILKKALSCSDAVIVSAGASVGKYDFARPALKQLGAEFSVDKVAMKPGRPFAFCRIKNLPVFLLPGNPVSTLVTYEKLVKPALFKMAGKILPPSKVLKAVLLHDIKKEAGRKEFLRGILFRKRNGYFAKTTGGQSSGILNSLVKANCLIVAGEKITLLKKGTKVDVEIFE